MREIRENEAAIANEKEERYQRDLNAAKRIEFTKEMQKQIERDNYERN